MLHDGFEHLDAESLESFVMHKLSPAEVALTVGHLNYCAQCSAALDDMVEYIETLRIALKLEARRDEDTGQLQR